MAEIGSLRKLGSCACFSSYFLSVRQNSKTHNMHLNRSTCKVLHYPYYLVIVRRSPWLGVWLPTLHSPGRLIRALVGATLAVALGGGVWLKFALMGEA